MPTRTTITLQIYVQRIKSKLINMLLGYTARAGEIVADADARIVAMVPRPLPVLTARQTPFFNHLACITSHESQSLSP